MQYMCMRVISRSGKHSHSSAFARLTQHSLMQPHAKMTEGYVGRMPDDTLSYRIVLAHIEESGLLGGKFIEETKYAREDLEALGHS